MYVRTKDGRILDFDKLNEISKLSIDMAKEPIREAKTIEELCDDFVGLIKSRSSDFIITKVIAHSLKELKDSLKTEFNGKIFEGHYDIIYGCIWTDKGLIYVAKMNESGDLELI